MCVCVCVCVYVQSMKVVDTVVDRAHKSSTLKPPMGTRGSGHALVSPSTEVTVHAQPDADLLG